MAKTRISVSPRKGESNAAAMPVIAKCWGKVIVRSSKGDIIVAVSKPVVKSGKHDGLIAVDTGYS